MEKIKRFAIAILTPMDLRTDFSTQSTYSLDYSIAGALGGAGDDQINSLQAVVNNSYN